ncbi:MAG: hypothetical protein ASUL_00110 [Candidatus Aramenus sulfurataquae]|uniref:ATPase n=2 Tax=Candidatus Aramenus sulfurataquae TaxID=1326980 RepID=W7KKV8_9CREN|nr:MAG: hypothetical protein ASUL_00110 [Candidatus Aramenus sulfurataquae]MBW9141207.1 hypothetical protein [Candidatus Aramenus sp.]MCI2414424.1 hypothetical protein [Candidatus Aramenus sp.]MCL7343147.1 hypothetical protein [Candidatus Aramenus sulfurataquae]
MEAEKYISIIKAKLDATKAEILQKLTEEYNNVLKNKEKELQEIKRKALKEISK